MEGWTGSLTYQDSRQSFANPDREIRIAISGAGTVVDMAYASELGSCQSQGRAEPMCLRWTRMFVVQLLVISLYHCAFSWSSFALFT